MLKYLGMLVKLQKYESIKYMISVNGCLLDMKTYFDVIIDNADVYYGVGKRIKSKTPSGGIAYASNYIDNIDRVAINCIEIIDNHNKLK